jgi:hypothetical protein
VVGNRQLVYNPTLCRGVDLFNGEEASLCTPLSSYPPVVLGNSCYSSLEYSDWVLQRMKEIHRVVGVSCVGFEEQFMALLTFIEASCSHKVSASSSKLGNKGSRELRRLECSINYDSKGESSSCGKGKERGLSVLNEA